MKNLNFWLTASFISLSVFSLIVTLGKFSFIDVKTTQLLQRIFPRIVDFPFSILSTVGSFEVTGLFFAIIILYLFVKKRVVGPIAGVMFIAGTMAEVAGKVFLFHPSPPSIYFRFTGFIFPSGYIHTDYSYPSGHVFRTVFILVFLSYVFNLHKRIRVLGLLLTFGLTMIVSRVYLGEHWFSDVIGGALLGFLCAILAIFFSRLHFFKKLVF